MVQINKPSFTQPIFHSIFSHALYPQSYQISSSTMPYSFLFQDLPIDCSNYLEHPPSFFRTPLSFELTYDFYLSFQLSVLVVSSNKKTSWTLQEVGQTSVLCAFSSPQSWYLIIRMLLSCLNPPLEKKHCEDIDCICLFPPLYFYS